MFNCYIQVKSKTACLKLQKSFLKEIKMDWLLENPVCKIRSEIVMIEMFKSFSSYVSGSSQNDYQVEHVQKKTDQPLTPTPPWPLSYLLPAMERLSSVHNEETGSECSWEKNAWPNHILTSIGI